MAAPILSPLKHLRVDGRLGQLRRYAELIMKISLLICVIVYSCTGELKAQPSDLDTIRKNVAAAEKLRNAMSAKYTIFTTTENSKSTTTIDGLWFDAKYALNATISQIKKDGSKNQKHRTDAYDGITTRQNVNNETGAILKGQTTPPYVSPLLIGANGDLGLLGSLNRALDLDLDQIPHFNRLNWLRKISYEYVGVKTFRELKCHVVSITGSNKRGPVRKFVLYISPKMNWQVAGSKELGFTSKSPNRVTEVTRWKKLDNGFWMPQTAVTTIYTIKSSEGPHDAVVEKFQLQSAKFDCDPKDKRFSVVKFGKKTDVVEFDLSRQPKEGR